MTIKSTHIQHLPIRTMVRVSLAALILCPLPVAAQIIDGQSYTPGQEIPEQGSASVLDNPPRDTQTFLRDSMQEAETRREEFMQQQQAPGYRPPATMDTDPQENVIYRRAQPDQDSLYGAPLPRRNFNNIP